MIKNYVEKKTNKLIHVPRRAMHSWTKKVANVIYRGNINAEPLKTNIAKSYYATWSAYTRNDPPQNQKHPPEMEIDPETGYEILRDYDASISNHILLVDKDFTHNDCFLVYGVFSRSTSPKPLTGDEKIPIMLIGLLPNNKGLPPEMVANYTLEGERKTQYIHKYQTPKLVRKRAVSLHEDATLVLNDPNNPEYTGYLKTIKTINENQ